jgi:hypothetical protein
MYRKCRHIKPNGLRCDSPALKQANFCYFHSKIHTIGAEPNLKYGPMLLPSPEGPAAVLLSIAKINDALLSGRIDRKLAGVLLYSMQVASQNLNSHHPSDIDQTIESMTITPEGDELAPEEIVEEEDDDDAEDGDDGDEGDSDDEVDDDAEEADEGGEEGGSDEGNDSQVTDNDASPNPKPEEAEHPDAVFFKGLKL